MIRMNVSQEALDTGKGLIDVVKKIFWYQIFYKDAVGKDIKLMALQEAMYNSDFVNPLIKKLKIDFQHNLIKPLCDTSTSTFLGRVPDIVTNAKQKTEKERISKFSLTQKHYDFEEEIYDAALHGSISGSGFLCLYNEEGDSFPHYRSLDPKYTNVVYDCTVSMKRLFAYHIYFEQTSIGGRYVCIIYTKSKMYAFETGQISIPTKMAFSVYPLNLFLINGAEPSYSAEHGFSDIPIVEFLNNKQCISDCKPALPQIALYSALQNNRFQNVDDIMNYLLFIKNASLGDEKEATQAINLIKQHRVIALEGDNVDAKFLSNPLNQGDIQKLADDFKNEIHTITAIPDFMSVEFTQNASDPVLKAKTKPLLDKCLEKEKWFNKGYMKVLEMTLNFVEQNDTKLYETIKFDLANVDLVYTHTLPSNDVDAVNMIVNLANKNLLAPRVGLQWLNSIPNVDEYIKQMEEYNEKLALLKKNEENKSIDGGVNPTNIERQNEKIQSKEQMDNITNFVKGKSQDITE